MGLMQHTWQLVKKEALLEFRQKYAFGGILLYVVSTIFVIYITLAQQKAIEGLEVKTWNILFWVVILFAATNAIAKSFFTESEGRQLYYYTLVRPEAIILSKLLYNLAVMVVLISLSYIIFLTVLGNPVKQQGIFLLTMLLGGMGFSFLFTLISSIASKANNNSTMMAILGFPIVVPLIIFIVQLSREAYADALSANFMRSLLTLGAFNVILLMMSLILFPYLWRD